MISRLTFCAALFAAVTTVSLAYAADSAQSAGRRDAPLRRVGACRHRGHADGRSDRQARPLEKHFATGAAPTAPSTAPGPHENLSCGPFLLPERFRKAGNRRRKVLKESPPVPKWEGLAFPWRELRNRSCPASPPSTLMESSRLLPFIAGFVISAALLWLSSVVFGVARARTLGSSARLVLLALLIGGCGLWWPGHFLEPGEASTGLGGIPLVAATLALALAGLAGATALVATRKTVPAFAGLSLLTLGFAYAHSLFATPGLFRASAAVGSWGPAGAIVVLAAVLVGLGLEVQPGRKLKVLRVLQAAMGGLLLTLAASGSRPARRVPGPGLDRGAAAVRPGRDRRGAARGPGRERRAATRADAAGRDDRRRAAGRQPDAAADARLLRGPARRRGDQGRRQRAAGWRCCSSTSTASSRSTTPTATRIGDLVLEQVGAAPEGDVARQGRGGARRRRRVPAAAHQRPGRGGGGAGRDAPDRGARRTRTRSTAAR